MRLSIGKISGSRKMRIVLVVTIIGLIVVSILLISGTHTISKSDLTRTRIVITEQRIRIYCEKNGVLPSTLEGLPVLPGRDNETTDGWGRKLTYKVEGKKVTLTSSGDGEEGFTNIFSVSIPPI